MNNKDLAGHIAETQVFGPAVLGTDQTAVAVDLQDYMSAVVLIAVGVGGITFDANNSIDFIIRHKDLTGDSATGVAYTDLNGKDSPTSALTNGIVKSLVAAHGAAAVYEFGYIGGKRYLEVDIEFNGTHGTGTPISVTVVKGHPRVLPAN